MLIGYQGGNECHTHLRDEERWQRRRQDLEARVKTTPHEQATW